MKSEAYSGELARCTGNLKRLHLSAALLHSAGTLTRDQIERRIRDESNHLYSLLFLHFDINEESACRWELLARKLAHKHVPAFQHGARRRGRPRKYQIRSPKPVGRPRNLARHEWLKQLLDIVIDVAATKGWRGRGTPTRVLKHLLEQANKKLHKPGREVRSELRRLQHDFSEAKKKFPEIASKIAR